MTTILEMIVNIDCPGCESKVKKALQNLDGVDNVDIDMDLQKVTVTGRAEQEKILKTVRKTGKKAELWPIPSNIPEYTSAHAHEYFYSSTNHLYEHHSDHDNYNYINDQQYEYGYGDVNYNNYRHDYDHQQRPSSSIFGGRSTTMFSDENVNACSIM